VEGLNTREKQPFYCRVCGGEFCQPCGQLAEVDYKNRDQCLCKNCAATQNVLSAKGESVGIKSVLHKPQSKQNGKSVARPVNAGDEKQSGMADRRRVRVYHADGERAALHDVLARRAAFLIGAGPSLNNMDLSLLNQRGIVTMGINNSPAIFKPNYWICGDTPRRFIEQIWKDPTITKFVPHGRRDVFPRVRDKDGNLKSSAFRTYQMPNTYFFNRGEWFDARLFLEDSDFPWGTNPQTPDAYGIKGYKSTLILALKMLWYLGAGTVYLLGCDCKMETGKSNYAFEQNRTPEDVKVNTEVFKALNRRLGEAKPYFDRAGFKVINCTPDSGLKVFPYLEYSEAVVKAATECNEKPIQTEGMYEESN
jgi:hypothetical protein